MVYIGNHLSASKGFLAMGKKASSLGGNTFAFFTRNPRGGKAKDIDENDAKALMDYIEEHNFGKLVAHAPYTMNLCSDKPDIRHFALNMLKDDIERMEYTPSQYYNFHPGSHVGQGVEKGSEYIIEALNEALFEDQTTTVLLETMAGKGSEIGRTFEELQYIIERVDLSDKLGVCFDTCHTWDAGYDNVGDFDSVLDEFDKVIGIERLKAIHLNDSMNDRGSHKDRHQKLGEGYLGSDALAYIINHPLLQEKPFILETPNEDDGYMNEIAWVKCLSEY
ncbi:MAG: deoxyribonuclease IV [Lachnospiraceae bacterium]|nr:deoxyribonuclease IV [Lachnospiraceae bacterium]